MTGIRSARTSKSAMQQINTLRARVRELEETFLAIKRGQVDAVVVNGSGGDQVFTLQGAEHPYRILVETMDEGAGTLNEDGTILYANASFARILGVSLENIIGTHLGQCFTLQEQEKLKVLIENGLRGESRG